MAQDIQTPVPTPQADPNKAEAVSRNYVGYILLVFGSCVITFVCAYIYGTSTARAESRRDKEECEERYNKLVNSLLIKNDVIDDDLPDSVKQFMNKKLKDKTIINQKLEDANNK